MAGMMPPLIATFWNDHMIGTPIERGLLVKRQSDAWLQAGVVFIHIPKAAGTSFSQALYGRFLGHVRAIDVERWGSRRVRSLPRLAITRNPWDRLVSAYRFAKRGAGIGGARVGGVWRPQQYQIAEFESFDAFVRNWLVPRDPRKLDFVFQPQSPFVFSSDGACLVDHVGRFEELDSAFDFLRQRLPRLSPISRSNKSGPAVDYRSFYTPELVELVASVYTEDVARFGYSFE